MSTEIKVRVEVDLDTGGRMERLSVSSVLMRWDLDEMMPSRNLSYRPEDMVNEMKRQERRKRMVDALAGNIALELTNAIFKAVR